MEIHFSGHCDVTRARNFMAPWNRPRVRASRSHCPRHRKRESQRCVNGCETSRSQLLCWQNSKRRETIQRNSARSSVVLLKKERGCSSSSARAPSYMKQFLIHHELSSPEVAHGRFFHRNASEL